MKAPFSIVNRLAERIFERLCVDSAVGAKTPAALALMAFEFADAFGEESQKRFEAEKSKADTAQAMAKAGMK